MKIKEFLKHNLVITVFFMILIVAGSGLVAYGNYLLTPMATALKNAQNNQFFKWIIFMAVFSIVGRLMQYYASYIFTKQQEDYTHKVRKQIVNHYYSQFSNNGKISEKQNRLTNDLEILNKRYLNPVYNITLSIADLVFSAYFVLTFNPFLLLLIVILAFVSMTAPNILSNQLQKATSQVSEANNKYLDKIEKWLSGLAVLQRYHCQSKLLQVLTNSSRKLENANVNQSRKENELLGLTHIINIGSQALVLLLTGFLILNKQMTFGAFFSIGNFASLIFGQLATVASQIGTLKSTKELNNEVEKSRIINDNDISRDDLRNFSTLSTENLYLNFENGESLNYPDLEIKNGEKVLLFGDSGVGKSTLFKLILGEITPTSGKVVFKNKTGESINPDYSKIGYIPQDPVLFPGTIEENITMFNDSLNKKAENWIEKVQLFDDIQKFPEGVKTPVDLDKNNLSGGQRQKIILARTEVYNSKLILIDEGTSAIDSTATEKILENILKGPETVIFIAHNLNDKMQDLFDRTITLKRQVEN